MTNNISSIVVQTPTLKKLKTVFVPSTLALFLAGCMSGGSFFNNPVTDTLKSEAYASSEFYVNKLNATSKKEDQQTYRLLAVRKLLDENKVEEAKDMFAEITPELNEVQALEYKLISAQMLAAEGKASQALSELKLLNVAQLSQSQAARYYFTQAKIAENNNDSIEAVRARSLMDRYLTDNQARQENNNNIWALLRNTNRGALKSATPAAGETVFAGWIALAAAYQDSLANPNQIPNVISQWKSQYPNHPAVNLMPSELQNASNFQQTQVNKLALLLPLSSDAKILGDIIKKGFEDAKGDNDTQVQVFDTDTADVQTLLAQAREQGAQAVVGPLLKPRVDAMLASNEVNNFSILALNSTPNVRAIAKVCYYGLSPEAEARSGADKIYQDRISQVIVVAPSGDFGQRSAEAFETRWRQLTGNDVDVRYYNSGAEVISALQNGGATQGMALYILGSAEQLLDAKQSIDNSDFKDKLAIYTSSRSHSPNSGVEFFTTMEGVKFSEIPLLADTSSESYQKADSLAESDYSMMRLYAMGADAWTLAHNFNELRQVPGYKVSGLTGILSAGTNCNVERSMTWLQYRGGQIQAAY